MERRAGEGERDKLAAKVFGLTASLAETKRQRNKEAHTVEKLAGIKECQADQIENQLS